MTEIQNLTPRTDVTGAVIDCHDGCLRYFEGRFYLYGTSYGDTDGFTPANRFVVYSSPDLASWTFEGELLDTPLPGVSYRPYVVHNRATGQYVLWCNWYPVLWEGQFAVAMADHPAGPFAVVDDHAEVAQPRPGDHNLFVDTDGAAYLIYTSIEGDAGGKISGGHGMSVERLNDSFTGSTLENTGVFDVGVEAPAVFTHGGFYYAAFGATCCFCPEGSDARLFRSSSMMGPWEPAGQFNRGSDGKPVVAGQQTDIARVPTADGGHTWVWMADLWESRPDGVKGHDRQHWEPLSFDAGDAVRPLRGVNRWTIATPPVS